MKKKYATMLVIAAGLSLGSHFAAAETIPAANMPKNCQELMRKGFVIKHETITRSGTTGAMVATHPRPGSFAAPRKYGEGGVNKWFIDSFPAHPKEGCRICGVTVAVKGDVNPNNQHNDSITVVGSNTAAPQVANNAFNGVHKVLGVVTQLPSGPYSNLIVVNGPDWMNWYMAALVPSLDVMVQDDSRVDTISVTYFWY